MNYTIRAATADDVGIILRFITELAIYEKAEEEVEATEASLAASMFGPQAVTEAAILEADGAPAGFAVWFFNYSTWQARNGLYLEDLYVSPPVSRCGGRPAASAPSCQDCGGARLWPFRMERLGLERAGNPRL
jgi:hypothetical protein